MRASDEDALICDFAQYYHIYDIDSLTPSYAAVLACGLPEESRSVRAVFNAKTDTRTMLLAAAVDNLNFIAWVLCGGDDSGVERPEPISAALSGKVHEASHIDTNAHGFYTPESFEERRRKIIEADNNGR